MRLFDEFELPFVPTLVVGTLLACLVVTGLSEVIEPRSIPATKDWTQYPFGKSFPTCPTCGGEACPGLRQAGACSITSTVMPGELAGG